MKRSINQSVLCALILLNAFAYYSCEKNDPYVPEDIHVAVPYLDAIPEGNMLSYLNGNVNLDILPGAVSSPVRLSVNTCQSGFTSNYVLKTISIEPLMSFNVPVNVSLKYDGELANTESSPEGCQLCIHSWERQECFYNGGQCKTFCCYLDKNNSTINFPIIQTGVFAVEMKYSDISSN